MADIRSSARHVIVVGIDGPRPDMINEITMPNLTAMRARGVSSRDHRTVFPSETRGALTALANGARPETTGVLGNEFYSRDGSGRLTGTDTIHDWRAGEKRLIGGMVTATNLSETLAKNGKSFAVVTSSGQVRSPRSTGRAPTGARPATTFAIRPSPSRRSLQSMSPNSTGCPQTVSTGVRRSRLSPCSRIPSGRRKSRMRRSSG